MRADSTGRALKNLVAELASLDDDDIQAIISDLDIDDRGRIQDLLRSYRGGSVDLIDPANKNVEIDGWLGRRLTDVGSTGLTPRARDALAQVCGEVSLTTPRPTPPTLPAGRRVMGIFRDHR